MMLESSSRRGGRPAGAPGYRAYVVGDIHGRLDLLEDLLAKIHAELQHHPAAKTLLVFVGDLIDRGPSSAQVLERLWGGPETLIVISSDLSHYLPYEKAQAIDRATVQRILELDAGLSPHEACGSAAINGALRAARRHELTPRLLDLCNSGDTAGDRDRVVGYGAIAFEETP